MPTESNIQLVEQLRGWIEECTVAITADYTGLSVDAMNDLRRELREKGVQFRVVKNTLTHLAADAAGKPEFKEIVDGPTGIAFGYGDPVEPAKALAEYIRVSRSPLKIKGGFMDGRLLSIVEVVALAALPSKDELVARLLGQLQAPISGLLTVLNGPISGLVRVLQAHIDESETS